MTTDWNTRMDKLGAERGTWEDLHKMFPKPTCPKCGQPQPTNGPYLMSCHCEPRTVVFDGSTEMADQIGLITIRHHGTEPLLIEFFIATSASRSDDIQVLKGDTLIIDASGRAVGVKGEA